MAFRTKQTKQKPIRELRKEVELLRSFVIGAAGKDKEGDYRPEFVREILKRAHEHPTRAFKSGEAFLSQIRNNS